MEQAKIDVATSSADMHAVVRTTGAQCMPPTALCLVLPWLGARTLAAEWTFTRYMHHFWQATRKL